LPFSQRPKSMTTSTPKQTEVTPSSAPRPAVNIKGGIALIHRTHAKDWHIESPVCHDGPNVLSCILVQGTKRTPVVGVYLPPGDLDNLPHFQAALNRFPTTPIVLGDLSPISMTPVPTGTMSWPTFLPMQASMICSLLSSNAVSIGTRPPGASTDKAPFFGADVTTFWAQTDAFSRQFGLATLTTIGRTTSSSQPLYGASSPSTTWSTSKE
jgi:hypothetical protein